MHTVWKYRRLAHGLPILRLLQRPAGLDGCSEVKWKGLKARFGKSLPDIRGTQAATTFDF